MLLKCGVGEDSWESLGLQSILKEISPGISLEGMMLKLRLQYFGHLMWRVDSLEKTLIGGRRRRGWQKMRRLWMVSLTWWMWVWVNSGGWWWTGRPGCCDSWGRKESDTTEWLNWTEPCNIISTVRRSSILLAGAWISISALEHGRSWRNWDPKGTRYHKLLHTLTLGPSFFIPAPSIYLSQSRQPWRGTQVARTKLNNWAFSHFLHFSCWMIHPGRDSTNVKTCG